MFCKSYIREGTHPTSGKPMVAAELITKTAPESLPTTTDNIDNISPDWALGPGSSLVCTNPFGVYLMNDEFTWDKIERSDS